MVGPGPHGDDGLARGLADAGQSVDHGVDISAREDAEAGQDRIDLGVVGDGGEGAVEERAIAHHGGGHVDRVGRRSIRGDDRVEGRRRARSQCGEFEPPRLQRVSGQDPGAARGGDHGHSASGHRGQSHHFSGIEQVLDVIGTVHADLRQRGIDEAVAGGEGAGVAGGGRGPGCRPARLEQSDRNAAGHHLAQAGQIGEGLGIRENPAAIRLGRDCGEDLGGGDIGLVAGVDDPAQSQAPLPGE